MQHGWEFASGVSDQLIGVFQNPALLLGIPLALAGAVFMSLGAQYQHRGVEKVERITGTGAATGLTGSQLKGLLTRPSWILGTVMLGFAIVCQLSAMAIAPLIVVQPLGAVALVVTTLLNARVSGHTPTRKSLIAIGSCLGGIFLFVTLAALYATERRISNEDLFMILTVLLVVIIGLGACWLILRRRMRALFYVTGAGILYGFVATLAKAIISRIQAGTFDWLTVVCVIALVAAASVGAYFVQTAYSSGPPDLVIAGLTVIDPIVAVLIGALVLGEADAAPVPVLVMFAVAGAIAVFGVFGLARYHPQVLSESQDLGLRRGSESTTDAGNGKTSGGATSSGTETSPGAQTGQGGDPSTGSGSPSDQ